MKVEIFSLHNEERELGIEVKIEASREPSLFEFEIFQEKYREEWKYRLKLSPSLKFKREFKLYVPGEVEYLVIARLKTDRKLVQNVKHI